MTTIDTTILPRLPKLDWVQGIRDPIWGEIGITEVEKKIIQTEAFSRLRGIKQLSFAYLAFPGAVHSRFEHSIGVMHITDQLLKSIKKDPSVQIEIGPGDRQLLRLAALLHDIGHSPFSHAMENLFSYHPEVWSTVKENLPPKFKEFMESRGKDYGAPSKHEDFSDYLICSDPDIQRVLKEWVVNTNSRATFKIDEKSQELYIREVLAKLAIGEEVRSDLVNEDRKKLFRIFTGIMSGDIDADKIDYLARDNYYCGLPYELDLSSLRDQLAIEDDELTLLPNGIKFVNTVILARYWLITGVHQHMWDTFTTAKAVELLNHSLMLKQGSERAELILDIFTHWQDPQLIDFLVKSTDKNIKKILTTEYPLKEIGYLDYLETHPYIRVAMQILSETENHHHIPLLQKDLREALNRDDFFIHINRVKSPSFSMNVKGGNLLRNEILRGISEESLKNLRIVVYGKGNDTFNPASREVEQKINALPEQSEQIDSFIDNLHNDALKKLIAYLAIRRYRNICRECSDQKMILASDFLLLVMEAINNVKIKCHANGNNIDNPTRQDVYKVALHIHNDIRSSGLIIQGHLNLAGNEITPSFYREIRKYEEMGLISYTRKMDRLKREDMTDHEESNQMVYRFDRRFELSKYGIEKLEKIRDLRSVIPEYGEYLELWDVITQFANSLQNEIETILLESSHSISNTS